MHEEHVLSLINDEVSEIGEVEEDEGHHKEERMNPLLFQSFETQGRQEDPCSNGEGKSTHLHLDPTLCLDASLKGGTILRVPLNRRRSKFFSQLWAAYAYLAKEGALGIVSTVQRVSHEFNREVRSIFSGPLTSPTFLSALGFAKSDIYSVLSMRTHGPPLGGSH